jgi:hypothetical protein
MPLLLQFSQHYQKLLKMAQHLAGGDAPLYMEARNAMYDGGRPALGRLLMDALLQPQRIPDHCTDLLQYVACKCTYCPTACPHVCSPLFAGH